MRRLVDVPLAALVLRRALPLSLVLVVVVLGGVLVGTRFEPPDALDAGDAARVTRGLARQGILGGLALLLLPWLVVRAAQTTRGFARAEALWLAPRPAGALVSGASSFAGLWAAAGLALGAATLAAELAAGAGDGALRLARPLASPRVALLAGDRPARWQVDAGRTPAGALLRLRLAAAPGEGPSADVRVRAVRGSGASAESAESAVRVAGARRVHVPLPAGDGPIVLELERRGAGAAVLLREDGIELLVPAASERWAGIELGLRLWLAAGAWIALALGFGAWTSAATACALVLALQAAVWTRAGAPTWLPGGDLGPALAAIGDGLVPPRVAGRSLLALALLVATGLALAARGLAPRRSAR